MKPTKCLFVTFKLDQSHEIDIDLHKIKLIYLEDISATSTISSAN